MNPQISSCVF